MHRLRSSPRLLATGAALAGLVLTACGDDGGRVASDTAADPTETTAPDATGSPPSTVTVPLDTAPPSPPTDGSGSTAGGAAYDHPTGADEAVISITYEGGFVPVGTDFVNAPALLVGGDGTTVVPGAQIAIYPGPLLPALFETTLNEADIQALLARADELGLLSEVEYARNDQVADAPDTVVRITVEGVTYEHRAYALGLTGAEEDTPRSNLRTFVDEATALATELMAETTRPYESDAFLVQARPMTAAELGSDVEPTVVPWPQDATVRLADAGECATIPWDEGAELFIEATEATLFDDGGTTYQVTAVPRLPGRSC